MIIDFRAEVQVIWSATKFRSCGCVKGKSYTGNKTTPYINQGWGATPCYSTKYRESLQHAKESMSDLEQSSFMLAWIDYCGGIKRFNAGNVFYVWNAQVWQHIWKSASGSQGQNILALRLYLKGSKVWYTITPIQARMNWRARLHNNSTSNVLN